MFFHFFSVFVTNKHKNLIIITRVSVNADSTLIIKLQIGQETALFFQLRYFNCISLRKILLQCAVFAVLWLQTHLQKLDHSNIENK